MNIRESKKNKENIWIEYIRILPLILIVGLLPFIIRVHIFDLNGALYEFWNGEKTNVDLFTYNKKIFLYIIFVMMIFISFLVTPKLKNNKIIYILTALFGLLVIFSSVLSPYPEIVYNGFVEKQESIWVILIYIIIFIYAMNTIDNKSNYKLLYYAFMVSGMFISVIAIFQYFGLDLMKSSIINNFIIPSELQNNVKDMSFNFGKGDAYSIFYNPNYLGSYMSIYIPYFLLKAFFDSKQRLLFFSSAILGMLALFMSGSEAGIVGLIGAILYSAFIILRKTKNISNYNRKRTWIIALTSICILGILSYNVVGIETISKTINEAKQLFSWNNGQKIDLKEKGPLNNLELIKDNKVEIEINNNKMYFEVNEGYLYISESSDVIFEKVDFKNRNEFTFEFNNVGGIDGYIQPSANGQYFGIQLNVKETQQILYFVLADNQIFITDYKFTEIKPVYAQQAGFYNLEKIGSNRGYIWSRTLPLLQSNLILGNGPGTFAAQFPQADLYGKQAAFGPSGIWTIVDKPHNLYLEIAVQSGVISLVIFLVGIIYILFIFKRKEANNNEIFAVKSMLIAFFVTSLFNDSIIAVTPIVAVYAGILVAFLCDSKNNDFNQKNDL